MGARVSAKGVTKFGFGATDPTKRTSQNGEAIKTKSKGKKTPPLSAKGTGRAIGKKAKGATKTDGGVI